MTQNCIIRKTLTKRFFKSGDIINTFSYKRSFLEKILVNIGRRLGVRICTWLVAMHACIQRTRAAGHTVTNPRLQNAVAVCNPFLALVVHSLV